MLLAMVVAMTMMTTTTDRYDNEVTGGHGYDNEKSHEHDDGTAKMVLMMQMQLVMTMRVKIEGDVSRMQLTAKGRLIRKA